MFALWLFHVSNLLVTFHFKVRGEWDGTFRAGPLELNLDSFLRICIHKSSDLKVYEFDGKGNGYVNVEERYVRARVYSFSHAA